MDAQSNHKFVHLFVKGIKIMKKSYVLAAICALGLIFAGTGVEAKRHNDHGRGHHASKMHGKGAHSHGVKKNKKNKKHKKNK